MERVAVFVDAGYLFAQGSIVLAGRKLARGEIRLDPEKVVETLASFAERVSGAGLLRVYWYDGTSSGPSPQHITLAFLANVKLRLGFVNSVGEQKGVDSLIVTDMITLARNHAISDAVLLSGDEDLRVGVQQAQEFGVRVHLLGIEPSRGSQSVFLLQEADSTHEWSAADLAPFLTCHPRDGAHHAGPPPKPTAAPAAGMNELGQIATALAGEIDDTELETLVATIRGTTLLPKGVDGKLLARGRAALGHDLDLGQRKAARDAFLLACEARLAVIAGRR
jgi:hypothetical protein